MIKKAPDLFSILHLDSIEEQQRVERAILSFETFEQLIIQNNKPNYKQQLITNKILYHNESQRIKYQKNIK